MKNTIDLTQGGILKNITRLALPIIGTSFIQIAYNLTDMKWLGQLGTNTVAAVGASGFFMWLLYSLFCFTKNGAETGVSQAIGAKKYKEAEKVAKNAVSLALYSAIVINVLILLYTGLLLDFFSLESIIHEKAVSYLKIISVGMIFGVVNPTFTAIYNGLGNSKTPFYINTIGLIMNIILDPILIFGIGIIPGLEEKGAGLATAISQISVFLIFYVKLKSKHIKFENFKIINPLKKRLLKKILKVGTPIAMHQTSFCLFSMIIGRFVSTYGSASFAAQSVGANIEAFSWMTGVGFATALGAYTGQNYGSKKWNRIRKGYLAILFLSCCFGLLTSIVFWFYGKFIFSIFIKEPQTLGMGIVYLKILAVSQLFMSIEITSAGGFNGLGKTIPPSFTSILFTGLRVPAAFLFMTFSNFGVVAIWWCVSISSVFKGVIVTIWYNITIHKLSDANY